MDLVSWLAERYEHSAAEVWRERLRSGEIAVDDRVVIEPILLRSGQVIAWDRPPWGEPDVPRSYAVRHADDDVLVVSKPSGLPTMPAGGFLENTLLAVVREAYPEASPMHRLGRGTSGLVLFARTLLARRTLQAAFRDGRVEKVYRAIVDGSPAWDRLPIAVPIGPVTHDRLGTVFAASPGGRPARSVATVVERRGATTLVEVVIDTGRPHQIRIHLASVGHPLTGDPLYGPGGVPRHDALPGDLGYALHAGLLAFPHPRDAHRLVVTDPSPCPWSDADVRRSIDPPIASRPGRSSTACYSAAADAASKPISQYSSVPAADTHRS